VRRRSLLVATGALVGIAAGWLVAQQHLVRHRRDLFHPSPWRRLAALGFLAGTPGLEAVGALRDYVRWEPQPLLRRRAGYLLRRMEARLG
jgi:hypothetical protein